MITEYEKKRAIGLDDLWDVWGESFDAFEREYESEQAKFILDVLMAIRCQFMNVAEERAWDWTKRGKRFIEYRANGDNEREALKSSRVDVHEI